MNEVNESIRCIDATIKFKEKKCKKHEKALEEFEKLCKGEMDKISYYTIYNLLTEYIYFQSCKIEEFEEAKKEIIDKYGVGA